VCISCISFPQPDGERRSGSFSRRSVLTGIGGVAASIALGACTASPSTQAKLGVVLLGTQGGPPIDPTRTGISTALLVDGRTYIVDCGRASATQYVRGGLKLDSIAGMFITHLHADHIADYYNFFLLGGSAPNNLNDHITRPINVYGPGPAGGLPPKFGGGTAPTVNPQDPTPGLADLTQRCHDAYAYSTNLFMRDSGVADPRTLAAVHEVRVPDMGASPTNTAPRGRPFPVMVDDRVRVTATLVPHGPVFPSFAFRFDTEHGSVTFSGDETYNDNLIDLAHGTDMLIHEAINITAKVPPALQDHLLKSHVDVRQVGGIAQRAEAKHLVLSHIGDLGKTPLDAEQWRRWAMQGYDGKVTVGEDLQTFRLA